MNTSGRLLLVSILAIGLTSLGAGRAARGGFIASDLGPGGSFSSGSGYNVTGPQAFTGQGYGEAVEFTVDGTAPVAFGSAALALAYRAGDNVVTVVLASDDSGLPGASLETFRLAGLSPTASLVTVVSTAETRLDGGASYWIEALATGNTNVTWLANTAGSMGHLAGRLDTGSGPGPWSTSPGDADPAFVVNAAAVPAPPSATLLGIGVFGLLAQIARRKSRAA